MWVSAVVALALASPRLYFGPTANLPPVPLASNFSALYSSSQGLQSWASLRQLVTASNGALHARNMAMSILSTDQQQTLAAAAKTEKFNVSIEAGGAFCGPGSGTSVAQGTIHNLQSFLEAGGVVSDLLIESVFSRTRGKCPKQTVSATAMQIAQFAATLKPALGKECRFWLYDALPHYNVGKEWPANIPHYNLELTSVMNQLRSTMKAKEIDLEGYWMDCPFEYSRDYPNVSSPFRPGSGFEKIAATVAAMKSMEFSVAKTFNSQQGGILSDEAFHSGTLADVAAVASAVDLDSFTAAMVETWYPHPSNAAPESMPFTTAYTALEALRHFS